MKLNIRNILFGVTVGCAFASAALDLPVRRVNGKDYYVYTVQRNESLIDVANKLSITRDDIINTNPGAADGIKMGQKLYLPVSDFEESDNTLSGSTADGTQLRYKVGKGETLFGIAYRFGVTPDDIAALNPKVNAGVKAGDVILIPAGAKDKQADTKKELPKAKHTAEAVLTQNEGNVMVDDTPRNLRPVNPPVVEIKPEECAEGTEETTALVDDTADNVSADTARIALLMPLMLDDMQNGKQSKHSLDFVRGFMLGVKSMNEMSVPAEISVFDTRESAEEIAKVLSADNLHDVDVVIAPEDAASLRPVADAASKLDTYVLNLFAIQDTTYMTDSQVIQANIPAQLMYEKAAEALMTVYDGYKPVFLISKGGRVEKLPFTNYVRGLYAEMGVEPMEVSYDGMLSRADLDGLDITDKYVFIPGSGSVAEFNKFARALIALRDDFAEPASVGVFGYPDWTAFRGDALDSLHKLGATIYSRFYYDDSNYDTRMFNAQFEQYYGSKPIEQVPSQALLGYDTARYLLTNIKNNDGLYTPENQPVFTGLQSSFLFMTGNEYTNTEKEESVGGPVNQTLYIITFTPGVESVSVKIL